MLLRGIELPEIGTPRDRIMTRMFAMEQAQKVEEMGVLGMMMGIANRGDSTVMTNLKTFIDKYRDTAGFNNWSNEKRDSAKQEQRAEKDILNIVDNL